MDKVLVWAMAVSAVVFVPLLFTHYRFLVLFPAIFLCACAYMPYISDSAEHKSPPEGHRRHLLTFKRRTDHEPIVRGSTCVGLDLNALGLIENPPSEEANSAFSSAGLGRKDRHVRFASEVHLVVFDPDRMGIKSLEYGVGADEEGRDLSLEDNLDAHPWEAEDMPWEY